MTPEELKQFLISKGYKEDHWGHYHKEINGVDHRYKIQKSSVRHEKKIGDSDKFWFKKWSEYYCNLEINPDSGLIRRIKK